MRLEVHTQGFEKTDSVEVFLTQSAQKLADEFLRNDRDIHIKVNVDEDRHRSQARKPHFFCEVQVKTASSKKWFKTHKSSDDFRTSVYDAIHAMKLILQKRSDRRHDLKVVGAAPEIVGELEADNDFEIENNEPAPSNEARV